MVQAITKEVYGCNVCSKEFFDKGEAEKHEKSPEKPRYKVKQEISGHCFIAESKGIQYVFTEFRILDIKKDKHSFNYTLEPIYFQVYHPNGSYYSSPRFIKKNSHWVTDNAEDKDIIKSLEGKLDDKIVLEESKLVPRIYYR